MDWFSSVLSILSNQCGVVSYIMIFQWEFNDVSYCIKMFNDINQYQSELVKIFKA
jgi:hypothetical protein